MGGREGWIEGEVGGRERGRKGGKGWEGEEWEGAGGREWVGLVGGVRDALVVVHLNRSG